MEAKRRKTRLIDLFHEVSACRACDLAATRTTVVFGTGDPDADIMFVGEAPGFHEDRQGKPFVGQAGKLLDTLLAEIGLERRQVFIANVLKCRPPDNRDPAPSEIEACERNLFRQIELIEPRVICTLGNFATKLISGRETGISRVHGQPRECEIGGFPVKLFPLYHPAAALRSPAALEALREDIRGLPALVASCAAEATGDSKAAGEATDSGQASSLDADDDPAAGGRGGGSGAGQLALFSM